MCYLTVYRFSNRSVKSFMDSVSSTKSWLARKWSKTNRKTAMANESSVMKSSASKDTNNIASQKPDIFEEAVKIQSSEPVIIKEVTSNGNFQRSLSHDAENIAAVRYIKVANTRFGFI